MSIEDVNYVCPDCGSDVGFWEEVELSGWQSIEYSYLESEGVPVKTVVGGTTDRGADWVTARPTGLIGCGECAWQGYENTLKRVVKPKLGIDGKPLDKPYPGQLNLLA